MRNKQANKPKPPKGDASESGMRGGSNPPTSTKNEKLCCTTKRRIGIGDGEWHCPFPEWWVKQMKAAAKACEHLTAEQIEAIDNHIENGRLYNIKPMEFLNEPQDSRGLPLSWCEEEEKRYSNHPTSCGAIYDYDTIPEVVVTNGEDDWPLKIWRPIEAT